MAEMPIYPNHGLAEKSPDPGKPATVAWRVTPSANEMTVHARALYVETDGVVTFRPVRNARLGLADVTDLQVYAGGVINCQVSHVLASTASLLAYA
jgi:hypothetical protein